MEQTPFLEDIYPKNLLYGITIRSPVAKGRLVMVLVPKMEKDYTFISARDIPNQNKLYGANMPVFADSKLSYIGEPVGILLGHDKTKLENFASKCVVVANEEEPVFTRDQESGIRDQSAVSNEQETENNNNEQQPPDPQTLSFSDPNLKREITIGNPDSVFESEDRIVTSSYSTGIQDHWYAEPAGAIAFYTDKKEAGKGQASRGKHKRAEIRDQGAGIRDQDHGSKDNLETTVNDRKQKTAFSSPTPDPRPLVIKTATQWPAHVRQSVASCLGVDPSSVKVEQTALSMHMDGKLWFPSLIACHAALGSLITKKPVRLILNREEDFFFSPKRCASSANIASSIDKKGKINAAIIDIHINLGAYDIYGNEILDQIAIGVTGYYNIENLKLRVKANCTNLPPQGPFSGFGISQGSFALERHISLIAGMAGIDPALWRKQNLTGELLVREQGAGNREQYDIAKINPRITIKDNKQKSQVPQPLSPSVPLIDLTMKSSDYLRKWASYELLRNTHKGTVIDKKETPRGIGISFGFQGNGLLNPLFEGYPPETYSIEVTLTKDNHLEIKTNLSSSEDYSKIWEKTAVEILSVKPGMLSIINDDIDAPDCGPSCSSRNITAVTKLVEKCCIAIRRQKQNSSLPITVRRSIKPQGAGEEKIDYSCFAKPGQVCAVVEVSIDLIECIPKIRGVWLGVDGGKLISKNRAKRSLTRGVVQALGWAFTENIEYIKGELPKYQYDNFTIPSPAEIPPIKIEFLENNKAEPKGIGELPFTVIPAAFLQAVSQAMDYSFKNIPLKRNEIWEMIKLRG